jgi:hypothetical protein
MDLISTFFDSLLSIFILVIGRSACPSVFQAIETGKQVRLLARINSIVTKQILAVLSRIQCHSLKNWQDGTSRA